MIELMSLIEQCVIPKHQSVMKAIVNVESGGKPFAIGLNKGYRLQTQPKNESQAKAWVTYLEQNNYNFDVGIGQVNIKNIHKYGYKASDALDPCLNLKISSDILDKNYQLASATSSGDDAIKKAISAYNTGNFSSGFKNGYVAKVNSKLKLAANNVNSDIPPIINVGAKPTNSTKVVEVKKIDNSKVSIDKPKQQDYENNKLATSNPYTSKTVMYVAPKKIDTRYY